MNRGTIGVLILAALALGSAQAVHAQTRTNWIGPVGTEAAWDQGDMGFGEGVNWLKTSTQTNFQPDAAFGEYGSISNGGVALIDHAIPYAPAHIRIAEDGGSTGTLVIRNGGAITTPGDLVNGGGGSGRLVLRQNIGTVSANRYLQNAASTLVAQLSSGSTFNALQATTAINLNGTLRVERAPGSNFTATAGQSWTILQGATVNDSFSSIAVDPALVSNPGQIFTASTAANAVTISVEQRLVLEVDRFSGATTLRNPAGHATNIAMISYTLRSAANGVSAANNRWSAFSDDASKPGWFEANPSATALSELSPQGSLILSSGQYHNFGTPLNANAAAPLGTNRVNVNDVQFQYQTPTGQTLNAVIQPVGRINDLVLVVNPTTGASLLQNQSSQSVQMISYTISSASGALKTDWAGLEGLPLANWFKASPTANNLSELLSTGITTMGAGAEFALGNAWNPTLGQDLTFRYQTPDGLLRNGSVVFGAKATIATDNADFDSDGDVDGADFLTWQRGLGLTGQIGRQNGDANGDTNVNSADLAVWKSQFGTTPGGLAVSVPEPYFGACGLAMGLALVGLRSRRGRRD